LSEIGQGLLLSGIGILITFAALGILILLIVVLKALFPVQDSRERDKTDAPGPDRELLKEKAAAAAVAVLLGKRHPGKGFLGSELEKPVGRWWQKGIDRIHGKE
jgi:hypothetical protein